MWKISLLTELLSLHGLVVALGLLIFVLASHTLQQRRNPAAAIGWVLAIVFIPYAAIPLYLIIGTRKLVRFRTYPLLTRPAPNSASDDTWPRQLAAAMGQPPVQSYQNLHIHVDGTQALQALWKLIDSAEHDLNVCSFILARDAIGSALVERLINKARGGIRVRLLLDGVGRMMSRAPDLRGLEAAGVQTESFVPLLHSPLKGRTNLRNHRKLVVADDVRLWCGGRNFAAEYFEGTRNHAPWRDLSFDLYGPLARQAGELFESDWAFATGSPRAEAKTAAPSAQQPFAQVIASGPDQCDDTIHALLVTACFKARSRIIAATAYFVPSEALLMALSLAARRGVTVDLILPARSNHRMADLARHRALRDLAQAGAQIWFVPYMLHAKAVVFDDAIAMVGSANLDARSLFLNYELMVAFYAATDVERYAKWMEGHREKAKRYKVRQPGLLRDLTEGLVLWLAFQL
ncbi:MAG TPA: phospholipase D-like domain-containing protein [Burkholderiales bacterium]|nr:phospholipase D-like domain-containing protein [Burkholderiales bacterium]